MRGSFTIRLKTDFSSTSPICSSSSSSSLSVDLEIKRKVEMIKIFLYPLTRRAFTYFEAFGDLRTTELKFEPLIHLQQINPLIPVSS